MTGKNVTAQGPARHRILAEVGSVLSESLDIDARLSRLADVLVPALADVCLIDVVEEGEASRSALRTVEPDAARAIRAIRARLPGRLPAPIVAALDHGRTTHLPEIDVGVLDGVAEDPEHRRLLERLGLVSGVVAPMLTPEGSLGAISLGYASSGRRYGEADVGLAEEVGRRAGLAAENALLHRRLARREQRFRSIFQESVDGMMLVSLDGTILTANPALCALLGYSQEELRGADRDSIVDEGDPAYRALLERRLDTERSKGELELIRKDGSRVPVEITSSAVEGSKGAEHSAVIVRDIRERRRREDELRRREAELPALLEHAPDVVTRYDRELRATYMSPAIESVTGIPPGEYVGRRAGGVSEDPDFSDRWEEALERVFRTGEPADLEFTFPAVDGPRRFLTRIVPEPGPDGEGVASVLAVSRDISALREAQEQARFRASLLDEVGEAVIASDLDGEILYWNRAAEKLYGWSAAEALGRNIVDVVPANLSGERRREIRERIRAGETWAGEFTVRRKDGAEIPIFLTDAPILDDDGRAVGIVGVSQDMSEQHRLEEKLRHAQKMQAIGRLAGGVAHDFNNVLTVIRGQAQLVLGELEVEDPLREDLEEILKAADRGASLTAQLLAFSRKQPLQPRVLDLVDVVEDVTPMLGRLMGEDVELATRLPDGGRAVEADRGQLEQVLLNLAVNARDAMPSGGRLTVEVADARVGAEEAGRYEGVEPGPFLRLSVTDTGVGMSPEVVEQAFDPFFTTKERGKGTGLGLSTVYGVIRQSGGFVTVRSEPGEGTAFHVFLPLHGPPGDDVPDDA